MGQVGHINTDKIAVFLFILTSVVSVATQIDILQTTLRPVMFVMWLITFAYLLVCNHFRIQMSIFLRVFLIGYLIYFIWCVVCSFVGEDHMAGNYISIMPIPLLVTLIAALLRNRIDARSLRKIFCVYAIATIIFAVYTNINYFSSYQAWLSQNTYAFAQKNSAAQIWFNAVFIIFFIILPSTKKRFFKAIWSIGAIYLIYIAGMSQCRTAILATGVVIAYQILRYSKHRFYWGIFFVALIVVLWGIPATNEYISQVFLLQKYDSADVDTVSSGRVGLADQALDVINDNLLMGVGHYYMDMSYISIWAESGIVGLFIIEGIWVTRIIQNFKNEKRVGTFSARILDSLAVFYIVEATFEALPPFGPGVSSFMLWFVSEMGDITFRRKES